MSHDRAAGSFSICQGAALVLTTPSGYLLYITQETRADRWFFVLDPIPPPSKRAGKADSTEACIPFSWRQHSNLNADIQIHLHIVRDWLLVFG